MRTLISCLSFVDLRAIGVALLGTCAGFGITPSLAATDALPSWNDGSVRQTIIRFVEDATKEGGAAYVAPDDRIAVFDNDGTLWAEQPAYFQLLFAADRIAELAPQHPEWADMQPFKAVLGRDIKALAAAGESGLLTIVATTHAGMTTAEFAKTVDDWLKTARHPRFKRPYTELVYQPMVELLAYLRSHGFKTFIVSGGGVEFMRRFADIVYGIPPEQVVGSSGATRLAMRDGKPVLVKAPKVEFIDDGPGKPAGINRFIGRPPILAFGNSDGDLQMLEWTATGSGPRFMGLIHHTDGEREWAYDRKSHVGKLDTALDTATAKGWTIVDMKQDWKEVFAREK